MKAVSYTEMQAPVMSCQGVPGDRYIVVVKFPKSLRRRCCDTCEAYCCCMICTFLSLSSLFFGVGFVWIIEGCQGSPHMWLEAMSIRDMAVSRNHSIPAPESPWQVDSSFTVRLGTRNPNTVAGCFCTFRRVVVRVEYRGQVIVHQEVPLGFGLKPRTGRPVSVELHGARFPLKNPDLGPFMENELRTGSVTLEFFFDTRYLRNDRKASWLNMGCHVVAKPPTTNSSQADADSLITQDCMGY